MAGDDLLERVGKVLILFASISLVTLLAFAVLVVFSYVEPYFSVPQVVESLLPALLLSILVLIAGTVALVASKVADSGDMNPPPP